MAERTNQDQTQLSADDQALLAAMGGDVEPDDQNYGDDEPPQGDSPVTPQGQGSGFMSADQVQQMLDNQRTMMMDTMQRMQQPQPASQQPVQEPQEPRTNMPTSAEVRRAFEENDPDAFMDIYNRGLQAVYEASEQRVRALEQAGMQRIQELSADVVRTTVPEYQSYQNEVNQIMDEFGIQGDLRANPKVVGLLVDAVKGRNLDTEVNRQIEARVRQAAQRQTSEGPRGRNVRDTEPEEPLFSMGALQALRNAGRPPDQHAQQMGYANWDEFEKSARDKYDNWQERSVPAWRRRLNERRQATGRRTT